MNIQRRIRSHGFDDESSGTGVIALCCKSWKFRNRDDEYQIKFDRITETSLLCSLWFDLSSTPSDLVARLNQSRCTRSNISYWLGNDMIRQRAKLERGMSAIVFMERILRVPPSISRATWAGLEKSPGPASADGNRVPGMQERDCWCTYKGFRYTGNRVRGRITVV